MGVETKVLEEGKDGVNSSKGDTVIVDLIGYFYDEAKGEDDYHRGKVWVSISKHDDERF